MPWGLIDGVGVYNDVARLRVEAELTRHGLGGTLPIQVKTGWYH
jgi:hypothetical protein